MYVLRMYIYIICNYMYIYIYCIDLFTYLCVRFAPVFCVKDSYMHMIICIYIYTYHVYIYIYTDISMGFYCCICGFRWFCQVMSIFQPSILRQLSKQEDARKETCPIIKARYPQEGIRLHFLNVSPPRPLNQKEGWYVGIVYRNMGTWVLCQQYPHVPFTTRRYQSLNETLAKH